MTAPRDEFRAWPLQLQRDCLEHTLGLLTDLVCTAWAKGRTFEPRLVEAAKREAFRVYQRRASAAKRDESETRTCRGCYAEVVYRVEAGRRVAINYPTGELHACAPGETAV